jgi:hypothetical protein
MIDIDPSHCLRPELTEATVRKLLNDNSINIIAATEKERRRTIEDISTIINTLRGKKLTKTHVIHLNIKSYVYDFQGLLKDWANQLQPFYESNKIQPTLEDIDEYTRALNPRRVLLILEAFDALFVEQPDALYNQQFMNNLNAFNNSGNVAMILTTQKPIKLEAFYMEKNYLSGSKLDISDTVKLPVLTKEQIQEDILRVEPLKKYLKDKPEHLDFYVDKIGKETFAYDFWQHLRTHIINEVRTLPTLNNERLQKRYLSWREDYQEPTSLTHKLSVFRKFVLYLNRITTFLLRHVEIIQQIKRKWLIMGAIITSIVFSIYHFWDKIEHWWKLLNESVK